MGRGEGFPITTTTKQGTFFSFHFPAHPSSSFFHWHKQKRGTHLLPLGIFQDRKKSFEARSSLTIGIKRPEQSSKQACMQENSIPPSRQAETLTRVRGLFFSPFLFFFLKVMWIFLTAVSFPFFLWYRNASGQKKQGAHYWREMDRWMDGGTAERRRHCLLVQSGKVRCGGMDGWMDG